MSAKGVTPRPNLVPEESTRFADLSLWPSKCPLMHRNLSTSNRARVDVWKRDRALGFGKTLILFGMFLWLVRLAATTGVYRVLCRRVQTLLELRRKTLEKGLTTLKLLPLSLELAVVILVDTGNLGFQLPNPKAT